MLCDPLEGGAYIGQYCIDVLKNILKNGTKKKETHKSVVQTFSGNNYASFEDQIFGSESRRRPCCPPDPNPLNLRRLMFGDLMHDTVAQVVPV